MKKTMPKKHSQLSHMVVVSALLIFVCTCGVEPGKDPGVGLSITSQSSTELAGEYHNHEGSIAFCAGSENDFFNRLSLQINERKFDVTLERVGDGDLHLTIDGHGNSFSKGDIELLRTFGLEFKERMEKARGPSSMQVHEGLVIAAIAYLSAFPQGYVHEARIYSAKEIKGITCIYKGDWLEATFTDFWGTTYHVWDEVGYHGGRGRCGDDWFSTGWTYDCFNHDECEIYMDSHGIFELPGGIGPNCLDEFFKALDDFFFSLLLGCTG